MQSPHVSEDYLIQCRKDIGIQLKEMRERLGLTMEQLAAEIDTSKSTISKIEAGKWSFSLDTITILSHHLQFKLKLEPNKKK